MSYIQMTPQVLKDLPLPDLDTLTEGDMVGLYVALRDAKAAYKKAFKQQIHDGFNVKMEALTARMLGFIDSRKLDGIKSQFGTAYRLKENSVTIADKEIFRDYVTTNHLWDYIDWRANKTVIGKLVEDGSFNPSEVGLNFSQRYIIGVRKAGQK